MQLRDLRQEDQSLRFYVIIIIRNPTYFMQLISSIQCKNDKKISKTRLKDKLCVDFTHQVLISHQLSSIWLMKTGYLNGVPLKNSCNFDSNSTRVRENRIHIKQLCSGSYNPSNGSLKSACSRNSFSMARFRDMSTSGRNVSFQKVLSDWLLCTMPHKYKS